MLQIHLLHTASSSHSTMRIPDTDTHVEITKNYHELAQLARYRWRMDVNPILPFHLAALEAMQVALDRGDSNFE
jgi:mediator of RNA polymerase II transcription subunit 13